MPTLSTFFSQVRNLVDAHEITRLNAVTLAQGTLATALSSMDLDIGSASAAIQGVGGFRSRLAGGCAGPAIQALLSAYFLQAGTIINSPNRVASATGLIAIDLNRYMLDVSGDRIRSRQFVRGATTPGAANAGTGVGPGTVVNTGGTVVRCLVTADGQPIESTFADTINFLCSQDRSQGALVQREGFDVWGQPLLDAIDFYQAGKGTGISYLFTPSKQQINAINSDTATGLTNTSFGIGGAAASTAPSGWTATTLSTNFDIVAATGSGTAATTYRTADSEGTAACSVKFKATDGLTQLFSTNNYTLTNDAPYYLEVAFNPTPGTFVGTLTISLGSYSYTITVSGSGWQTVSLPISKKLWLKNFDNGAIGVTISVVRTSGYLLVDDVRFQAFANPQFTRSKIGAYDNQWILIVSRQTNFAIGDTFTLADTETGAKTQRKMHLAYGLTLACAPPSPTAPTVALAGLGAGNVDNGAHTYAVTVRRLVSDSTAPTPDYIESGGTPSAPVTVVDKTTNGKVALSAIAVGAAGTYSRRIWRSKLGTATPLYLLAEITDNTTLVYTDNIADASLPATTIPAGITQDDP